VPDAKHTRLALRAALALIVLAVLTHTRADPDLFGHVRFGGDIVASRSAQLPDRYSFASDRPWINHEWLAETIMYGAYRVGGAAGLVALKLGLLAAMIAGVTFGLARYDLPPGVRDLLIAFVVIGTFPQSNHVRPQLFSLALFAWLLASLVASRMRASAVVWAIPLMAFWVNLHGGWLVGAGALAAWTAGGLMTTPTRRDAFVAAGIGVIAVAATLINPYGWHMWAFLRETVGFGRADITDWQPVFALGAPYVALWVLTAAVALPAIRRSIADGKADLQSIAIVALFGLAALRVSRLLSFFTIATAVLLAPQIASVASRFFGAEKARRRQSRFAAAAALANALALAGGAVAASAQNVGCIRMETVMFPESAVAATVADRQVHGRMLTWFDWGEYAIWHFAPDVVVSMDGRRETVYSEAAIQRQLKFFVAPEDRRTVLAALKPDYIWVPSNLAVTARLLEDGWQPLFRGSQSTLLARADLVKAAAAASDSTSDSGVRAPRCFPGP
jgi:hypothetical protein